MRERLMWVVWPSFLMASVLEMLVFALLDPLELHWMGHVVDMSRQGIYTMTFFAFWLVIGTSSALSVLLSMPQPPSE